MQVGLLKRLAWVVTFWNLVVNYIVIRFSVFCAFVKDHIGSYVQSWNIVTVLKHLGRMFCWNHVKDKATVEPQVALASALYYASEKERETTHCFLLFHEMRELLRKQNSVVHLFYCMDKSPSRNEDWKHWRRRCLCLGCSSSNLEFVKQLWGVCQ